MKDADDDSPGHKIGIWTAEACIEAEADFSPASHALRGKPPAQDYAASQNLRLQKKTGTGEEGKRHYRLQPKAGIFTVAPGGPFAQPGQPQPRIDLNPMTGQAPAQSSALAGEAGVEPASGGTTSIEQCPDTHMHQRFSRPHADGSPLTDGFKRTDIANMRWKHTVAQVETVIRDHVIRHWRLVTFGWSGEDSPRDEQGNKPSRESLLKKLFGDEATTSYLNEFGDSE
jgi:hypothetical protein